MHAPLAVAAMNRATLAFSDGQLERAFRAEYARKSLPLVRFSLLLAIALYATFGFLDSSIIPDAQAAAWLIRYAVFCPYTLAVFGLTFSEAFPRRHQHLLVLLSLLAAAGITAMIVLARPPGSDLYYAGLLLTCSAILTFFRLRVVIAVPTAWAVVVMYEVAALLLTETPAEIVVSNSFFLIGLNIIGMAACSSMEWQVRRESVDRLLIGDKTRQIDALRQESEYRSRHDDLTGLPNRRDFYELVEERISQRIERLATFALVMIDVDHFKRINDTFGHSVGDDVLREVACRLRGSLRRDDVLYRYGGEEFLLLLPETGVDGAVEIVERVRALVASRPIRTGDLAVPLTVSLGVAPASAELEPIDLLVERADAALFRAKQRGRDRVVLWDTAGHARQSAQGGTPLLA